MSDGSEQAGQPGAQGAAPDGGRAEHAEELLHQLILMRETGPRSAAWHRARTRMIWRLHRIIERRRGSSNPHTLQDMYSHPEE